MTENGRYRCFLSFLKVSANMVKIFLRYELFCFEDPPTRPPLRASDEPGDHKSPNFFA